MLALFLALPVVAAGDGDQQLLGEFRKARPDVSQVHVIADRPLLVAVTGGRIWSKGELLGVFAHDGDRIVTISTVPNNDLPAKVWVARETPDSITLGLADPDFGIHTNNLEIFFDPKTYLPKKMMQFSPVHIRHITTVGGLVTLNGYNDKLNFTAREHNGGWHITTSPVVQPQPPQSLTNAGQIPSMPVSTFGQLEQTRPARAEATPQGAVIEEKIGPYEKIGTKIWVGKTFQDNDESAGIGDVGYFDSATQDWVFLHIKEMADWSASALLVEPNTIWIGRDHNSEDAPQSGGLLRYDRATKKVTVIALPDVIEKIIRAGNRIYCGTTGGFAVVDLNGAQQDHARRFAFTPQMDGVYTIIPET